MILAVVYLPRPPGTSLFALMVMIGGRFVPLGTATSDVMIPRISVAFSTSTISQIELRSGVPDWLKTLSVSVAVQSASKIAELAEFQPQPTPGRRGCQTQEWT